MDEVANVVNEHEVDVIVLTETKTSRRTVAQTRNQLRNLCPEHRQYYSMVKGSTSAGVTVMVHRKFADMGLVEVKPTHPALDGYIRRLEISMPASTPVEVIGVYMPSGQPGDSKIRQEIVT